MSKTIPLDNKFEDRSDDEEELIMVCPSLVEKKSNSKKVSSRPTEDSVVPESTEPVAEPTTEPTTEPVNSVTVVDYSEKSFVVRGDTMAIKEHMKSKGGLWNSRLKGGGAWLFPKTKREAVETMLSNIKDLQVEYIEPTDGLVVPKAKAEPKVSKAEAKIVDDGRQGVFWDMDLPEKGSTVKIFISGTPLDFIVTGFGMDKDDKNRKVVTNIFLDSKTSDKKDYLLIIMNGEWKLDGVTSSEQRVIFMK